MPLYREEARCLRSIATCTRVDGRGAGNLALWFTRGHLRSEAPLRSKESARGGGGVVDNWAMTEDQREDADTLFGELVEEFRGDPAVAPPAEGGGRRFGAATLKVEGKIFAMLTGGELVVKLPRRRVDELVALGIGGPFDTGRGRVMKEWVTIAPRHGRDWRGLAREAREFVAGGTSAGRRGS